MELTSTPPLVTVLTPVYNGAEFLRECIESVLAQDYQAWEYVIVNNRSTDETLAIAESYAAKDARIRVTTNTEFLSMPQNFNRAFGMVSPQSRYFKVVCADDWIDPRFLSKMVGFAEDHPSVGIVACHQQSGRQVRWAVLPPSTTVLAGRDACRMVLLQCAAIFPAPTAALYRTSLLAHGKPFFPNDQPHSDTSACYEHLHDVDFGVVHEVLAAERVHEGQITSRIADFAAGDVAYVEGVLEYGPRYLSAEEYAACRDAALSRYYLHLGRAALRLRGGRFWDFHRSRLAEHGLCLDRKRVAAAALRLIGSHVGRPAATLRKAHAAWR
jgi:glycosyltransferase involved in cell wall biosynthesis